eukprot:scaffold171537_cov14-Tisochrysis_lutea.AAC.1
MKLHQHPISRLHSALPPLPTFNQSLSQDVLPAVHPLSAAQDDLHRQCKAMVALSSWKDRNVTLLMKRVPPVVTMPVTFVTSRHGSDAHQMLPPPIIKCPLNVTSNVHTEACTIAGLRESVAKKAADT